MIYCVQSQRIYLFSFIFNFHICNNKCYLADAVAVIFLTIEFSLIKNPFKESSTHNMRSVWCDFRFRVIS